MSNKENTSENLQLFEDQIIRTAWNEEEEEWYFSIVDVVGVLKESPNPNNYWKVLKKRLRDEGNESVTSCNQLKLKSPKDGKRYNTALPRFSENLFTEKYFRKPKDSVYDLLNCPNLDYSDCPEIAQFCVHNNSFLISPEQSGDIILSNQFVQLFQRICNRCCIFISK